MIPLTEDQIDQQTEARWRCEMRWLNNLSQTQLALLVQIEEILESEHLTNGMPLEGFTLWHLPSIVYYKVRLRNGEIIILYSLVCFDFAYRDITVGSKQCLILSLYQIPDNWIRYLTDFKKFTEQGWIEVFPFIHHVRVFPINNRLPEDVWLILTKTGDIKLVYEKPTQDLRNTSQNFTGLKIKHEFKKNTFESEYAQMEIIKWAYGPVLPYNDQTTKGLSADMIIIDELQINKENQ